MSTAIVPQATYTALTFNGTEAIKFDATGITEGIKGNVITSGTSVTASGTSVDFTDIPSWVKRITVMFSGVSTLSTSFKQIQLGDAGGIETTGYLSTSTNFSSTTTASALYTSGFVLRSNLAADLLNGSIVLTLLDSSANTWSCVGVTSDSVASSQCLVSGSKALSATLTQVRITTVNGTDTFDAGSINILYE